MISTLTVRGTIRSCVDPCRAIKAGETFQANLQHLGALTSALGTVTRVKCLNHKITEYTVDWGEVAFPTGYSAIEECHIESFGCPSLSCCPTSFEISNVSESSLTLTLHMDNGDEMSVEIPQCASS